jgi:hypothetical protein
MNRTGCAKYVALAIAGHEYSEHFLRPANHVGILDAFSPTRSGPATVSRSDEDLLRTRIEAGDGIQAVRIKQGQRAVAAQDVAAAVAADDRGVQERHAGTAEEVGHPCGVVVAAGPVGRDLLPANEPKKC